MELNLLQGSKQQPTSINQQQTTIQNQSLTVQNTPVVPEQPTPSVPTILKLLIAFLTIQLILAIGVLVVKIIFGFIGWDYKTVLTVDQNNCANYLTLQKYETMHIIIIQISLVAISATILFTIILLAIAIKYATESRRLPLTYYQNMPNFALSSQNLHLIIGPKTRVFMYILQSMALLGLIIVLGYYLTYFIKFQIGSCGWIDTTTNTTLAINFKIIIIWAIAAAAFIFAWAVWIIIAVINIKNRDTYLDQQQAKNREKQYLALQNNTLNTEMNATTVQQNNKQQKVLNMTQQNKNNYHDSLLYKSGARDEGGIPRRTRTDDSEKYPSNSYQPGTVNNLKNSSAQKENPTNYNINYISPGSPQKKAQSYENPVFKDRIALYNSPYQRIQHGKHYEGENTKKPVVQMQMSKVQQFEKDKQFKRSRFNTNSHEYDNGNHIPPAQQNPYFKSLSRHRLQQQQKLHFKPEQSRQIFPQSNYASPKSGPNFEGAKPRLHTTYFKQEGLNKRRYENSDEKKKRKGILQDYIRGKYIQ